MFRSFVLCLLLLQIPAWSALQWEKPWKEFHRSPDEGDLRTKFAFQNTSAQPVTIKSVKTSCGCTTAHLEKKTYAPGERGEIDVHFVFGDRKGAHRKMITVTTDDDAHQELNFVVFIHPALTLAPALVYWKRGQPGEAKEVQLNVEPGVPLRVKSVVSSDPQLAATLETVEAGKHYLVRVKPASTEQKASAEITVQTDYPPDAPRAYAIHARIK